MASTIGTVYGVNGVCRMLQFQTIQEVKRLDGGSKKLAVRRHQDGEREIELLLAAHERATRMDVYATVFGVFARPTEEFCPYFIVFLKLFYVLFWFISVYLILFCRIVFHFAGIVFCFVFKVFFISRMFLW